jgi:hypothetical protein
MDRLVQTSLLENVNTMAQESWNYIKNEKDGAGNPKFGELSVKAQQLELYVFNNEQLEDVSNTVFDDGKHVFVGEDFLKMLVKEERHSKGQKYGLEPLFLLHVKKMLSQHQELTIDLPENYKNNLLPEVERLYEPQQSGIMNLIHSWKKVKSITPEECSEVLHKAGLDSTVTALELPIHKSTMDKLSGLFHMGKKDDDNTPKKNKM